MNAPRFARLAALVVAVISTPVEATPPLVGSNAPPRPMPAPEFGAYRQEWATRDLPPSCRQLQFSADGRTLFIAHRGRTPVEADADRPVHNPGLSAFDIATGRQIFLRPLKVSVL